MKSLIIRIRQYFLDKPSFWDVGVLSLFTIGITFQPYFWHGSINLFETGLYLPGINAVLNGEIPYRDFFHLRGPLEVYIPAMLMKIFGVHIKIMYLYFYIGTVIGLIACVCIAYEILQTRFLLYLLIPILVGRT